MLKVLVLELFPSSLMAPINTWRFVFVLFCFVLLCFVALFHGRDHHQEMFQQVNGVLFPGGGQDLDGSQLLHTTQFFVKKSLMAYGRGDYFPVAGHCQGFEVMLMAITGLNLEQCMVHDAKYRAENISLPLHTLNTQSRWFADMSPSVQNTLTSTAW